MAASSAARRRAEVLKTGHDLTDREIRTAYDRLPHLGGVGLDFFRRSWTWPVISPLSASSTSAVVAASC